MKKESSDKKFHLDDVAKGTFYRKGKTGDWKTHFSEKQVKRIQRLENARLGKVGLKFVNEISD